MNIINIFKNMKDAVVKAFLNAVFTVKTWLIAHWILIVELYTTLKNWLLSHVAAVKSAWTTGVTLVKFGAKEAWAEFCSAVVAWVEQQVVLVDGVFHAVKNYIFAWFEAVDNAWTTGIDFLKDSLNALIKKAQ